MSTVIDIHECGIDCERIVSANGNVAHVMYPAEPNRSAGRYQAAQNVTMTRREYRASGQDESRNVRVWNLQRAERADRDFCYVCERVTRWDAETCQGCGREWGYEL